jgi:hypothetical protein
MVTKWPFWPCDEDESCDIKKNLERGMEPSIPDRKAPRSSG